jgi:hypothetical protein
MAAGPTKLPVAASIAVVAAVYVLTLAALEKRAFWITDNANKFLQLQAIVRSGYTDAALDWPGRRLDPELRFNPLPPPFSHVENGKVYSQYSPVFAVVSSFPYRWFSFPGLYLLPLLGSVLLVAGVARLAATLGCDVAARHAGVLIVGLGTPVWFYAVVFWEHAIAVGLAVWAVDAFLRFTDARSFRTLAAGSALAGAAACFREELVLLCAVLLATALWCARGRRGKAGAVAILTMAAALAPLPLLQWTLTGTPWGFHVGSNVTGLAEHLAARPAVAFKLFAAAGHGVAASLLIAAPFLVLFFWNPRLRERTFARAVPLLALTASVAAAISLAGFFGGRGPIVHLIHANSLFPAAPVLLLGLVRGPQDERPHATRLWWIVLAFSTLYFAAAPPISAGGIHWGNRFLLVAYPLLGVLAARNVSRSTWRGWPVLAVASTLALSLGAQVYSIRLLDAKQDFSYRAAREASRHAERVWITDQWWVPQELFSEFHDREIFFARTAADRAELERRLRDSGRERHLFITTAARGGPDATVVDDGGLDFFSLAFESRP